MTNDKADHRRSRGAWLGLLLVLLLALGGYGYAVSPSPSAPTGPKSPSTTSSGVLAPATSNGSSKGGGNGGTDNCVDPSSEAGNCEHHFGVTVGQAQTLYPGVTRALPVTYSNPNSFDILVKTYQVSVSVPAGKASLCPASNLVVPSGTVTLNPSVKVARNASAATTIPVRLSAGAPDGCQLVTFGIVVNASAVKK